MFSHGIGSPKGHKPTKAYDNHILGPCQWMIDDVSEKNLQNKHRKHKYKYGNRQIKLKKIPYL